MAVWADPEWPQPGESATIHYKITTREDKNEKTWTNVHRILVIGRDPFGPNGSLDGRLKRDNGGYLARFAAKGHIENDPTFDAFASEVFRHVVQNSDSDDVRALAAEQMLLVHSSETKVEKMCSVCCRAEGWGGISPVLGYQGKVSGGEVKFHRKTNFGWRVSVDSQTHGTPAIVSNRTCLSCLENRLSGLAGIMQSVKGCPISPEDEVMDPNYNVNNNFSIVRLCGVESLEKTLVKLRKLIDEIRK